MDLTTLSLIELKALGYDTISQLEQLTNNLRVINTELSKRLNNESSKRLDTPAGMDDSKAL